MVSFINQPYYPIFRYSETAPTSGITTLTFGGSPGQDAIRGGVVVSEGLGQARQIEGNPEWVKKSSTVQKKWELGSVRLRRDFQFTVQENRAWKKIADVRVFFLASTMSPKSKTSPPLMYPKLFTNSYHFSYSFHLVIWGSERSEWDGEKLLRKEVMASSQTSHTHTSKSQNNWEHVFSWLFWSRLRIRTQTNPSEKETQIGPLKL